MRGPTSQASQPAPHLTSSASFLLSRYGAGSHTRRRSVFGGICGPTEGTTDAGGTTDLIDQILLELEQVLAEVDRAPKAPRRIREQVRRPIIRARARLFQLKNGA